MKFKIIPVEDCQTSKEVLLQVCRHDDNDNVIVEISAWHIKDDDEQYQLQVLEFPNIQLAESFVADFSKNSATLFVCDYTF